MGYYSDVAIAIRKRDAKRLFDEVAKLPDDSYVQSYVKKLVERHREIIDDADPNPEGVQILRWYGVKWYDEYGEIKYIMDFIRSLGDGNYEFMRTGEEYDDVEHEGYIHNDCCLYLERDICFDPSELPLHGSY